MSVLGEQNLRVQTVTAPGLPGNKKLASCFSAEIGSQEKTE
jgi:hypothetical protein